MLIQLGEDDLIKLSMLNVGVSVTVTNLVNCKILNITRKKSKNANCTDCILRWSVCVIKIDEESECACQFNVDGNNSAEFDVFDLD